jgi:sugar/nucleoside kinase (ribokinase family)
MTDTTFDLLAIGNALVDVIAHADDAFIEAQDRLYGMKKGSMTLIDEKRAVALYADMGQGVETSGGSAGNTMAGFASFGGKGAYIGKVAGDPLGNVFAHDLKTQGVAFATQALALGAPTGRCLILVTPDGQRTMNTFLGAAVELSITDIDAELVAAAAITYLEGYLFDPAQAKAAFRQAAKVAHDAGRRVSLSLSDSFCVGRHRDDFLDLVENHVDILFANEDEIKSLYQTDSFEEAAAQVAGKCEIAAVTRGERGAVVIAEGRQVAVPAQKVKLVDTTGAGDQFAAGFLYGFTQGRDLATCGRLGVLAASEVIGHIGPRPETKYADLIRKAA